MPLLPRPYKLLAFFCSTALVGTSTLGLMVAPDVDVLSLLHLRPEESVCPEGPVEPASPVAPRRAAARHVIHISVDGLRPDAITALGAAGAPALYRFRREGAFTDNARTDYATTVTLPNHVSQLTGRAMMGRCGHNWAENGSPTEGATLHANKGHYVASVFDVAHDHGLRTVAFASKSKFSLLDASYNGGHGAVDTTGADDGRDKIDRFVHDSDTAALAEAFIAELKDTRFGFGFLHLRDPDSKGHRYGWDVSSQSPYLRAVQRADSLVGSIVTAIAADPALSGSTTVILTADHGGVGGHIREGHGYPYMRASYTIPFYVWGAGVEAGADLYALNRGVRRDPGQGRPSYRSARQPIRNGDAANLALALLGLRGVPGGHINHAAASLSVSGHPDRFTTGEGAAEG
jgi:hypothetical protein